MLRAKREKKAHKRSLRIFFATDVHGSDRCFRKFLAAAQVYEADVLLLGGDIAGKGLVPIRAVNGTLHATVHGEAVSVPAGEAARLRGDINRLGFYGVPMDDAEAARLREDPDYVDRVFRDQIAQQVEQWCDLADERLAPAVRCIIT